MSQTKNEHHMLSEPRTIAPIRLEERPDGAAILRLLREIHPELDAMAEQSRTKMLLVSLPGAQLTITAQV